MTAPGASPVSWLGPYRLGPAALLDDVLEVTLPPDALLPFARLRADPATLAFQPEASEPAGLADHPPEALRAMRDSVPAGDRSRPTRMRRWAFGTALAAAEATASLRRLGGLPGWQEAAAAQRDWYLRAVDGGMPPPAAEVAEACRAIPHGLRHLGKGLPTAEAVRLLAPLGRTCEVGAGFGLFARALERAGLEVAASDLDDSAGVGVAFPVRKGLDAAGTLAWFAARGPCPPVLVMWPQFEEGDWYADVFAAAGPGQVIGMASPEFEFCAGGGLAAAPPSEAGPPIGWRAAEALATLLADRFEQIGEAPVVPAGWPAAIVPLRLWKRNS